MIVFCWHQLRFVLDGPALVLLACRQGHTFVITPIKLKKIKKAVREIDGDPPERSWKKKLQARVHLDKKEIILEDLVIVDG